MAGKNVIEVKGADFDNTVLKSDVPVIVDFWAPWCGPCRAIAPIFEKLSNDFGGKVKFVKVNVDDNPDIAGRYRVMNIPTLLIFKDGSSVEKIIGLRPAEAIADLLNKYI